MSKEETLARRNFGAAAEDYARHRPGFPKRAVELLQERGHLPISVADGRSAPAALDLGTGTGTLARHWARLGFRTTGLDPDRRMLQEADRLAAAEGLEIAFLQGVAEVLPLAEASFDLISAGQCWHWFEPQLATAAIAKVLKPEGVVVVAHFDWLPLPGSLPEATEALILKHNSTWQLGGGEGLHPQPGLDLEQAGFQVVDRVIEDVQQPFSPEAWRGRIRASVGIAASLAPEEVEAFDRELADLLQLSFPGVELQVPHRLDMTLARLP